MPDPIPLVIMADMVGDTISKLGSTAGPGGINAVAISSMDLQFGKESEVL